MTTSGRLAALMATLTPVQQLYVRARQSEPTVARAAQVAGVHRTTVYGWPDEVEAAVALYVAEVGELMDQQLMAAGERAMACKIRELDSPDPVIAARAATEIIDRIRGKATLRVEQKLDAAVEITDERARTVLDGLVATAAKLRSPGAGGGP